MKRAAALLALATALAWSPLAAAAGDDPEALVNRGLELRRERKDSEALAAFERAQAIAPSPRTRAQIALAEQALGLWTRAEVDLAAALGAADDPWIKRNAQPLGEAMETIKKHLGSLEAHANVAQAELLVDGKNAGPLEANPSVRVAIGRHVVEVRAPRHRPASRTIDVEPGMIVRERFELVAEDLPPGAPPGSVHTPVVAEPSSPARTVGWALAAGGLVTGAFSVTSFVISDGRTRDYNEDPACPGQSSPIQPPGCREHVDASDTWRTIGIATAIGGGLLATVGVVLVLTAPPGTTRSVACTSAGCSVRF